MFVFTSKKLKSDKESVYILSGDAAEIIARILKPKYRGIWVVGSPSLIKDCLKSKIVDEINITTIPIILRDGRPFFDQVGQEIPLHLEKVIAFNDGMVETVYSVVK